jgi:hypothetical protein
MASPQVLPQVKTNHGQSFSPLRRESLVLGRLRPPDAVEISRNRRIHPGRSTSAVAMSLGRRRRRKTKRGRAISLHQNRIVA